MSKGSRRRPENAQAIAANWPLGERAPSRLVRQRPLGYYGECPTCREPMSPLFASDVGWVACPDHRVDYDPAALRNSAATLR